MADLDAARENPADLLWSELRELTAGMLGVRGSADHAQPMAHQCDPDIRRIWFLTNRTSDLCRSVGGGAEAEFTIVSRDRDVHASIVGRLSENRDDAKLDRLWNPVIGAWFDGKDDPDLAMLAFDPARAALWASTDSTVAFLWETAKANATDSRPDVGVRREIEFA